MTPQESGAEIRANALYLEGIQLNAKTHTFRDIAYVIGSLGKSAIVENIELTHLQNVQKNPGATVERPSMRVMNLGSDKHHILTDFGLHNRTNIHRSIIEIQAGFHDHWRTIVWNDFTPEVRSAMSNHTRSQNWLMLRNPGTDPEPVTPLEHLPMALGFIEPAVLKDLKPKLAESLKQEDGEIYRSLYDELTMACYESVDRQTDTYGKDYRSISQIGMIVALANLGVELQGEEYLFDPEGYTSHLKDAREYAYNMRMDEIDSYIGIEIERVDILRNN